MGVLLAGSLALTACGASSSSGSTEGGAYKPGGNVTMTVPFGAGGGSDLSGRAIAAGLEKITGVNISTENKEGGSGAVGYAAFLAKAGKADQLLATETAMLALPLTQDVPFTYEDFTPIMKLGDDFTLLTVSPDSPYETCTDVVNAAKDGRVVAAVSGATSLDQIVFSLIEKETGVEFDRVPYESGNEVVAGLLGGQVDVISVNPGEVLGQLEAGTLKPLCAIAENRYEFDSLKDIPTAAEQGIDVAFAQFRGFIAPGNITDEEKQFWIDAAKEFEQTDEYAAYIEDNLMQANAVYGDDFKEYLTGNAEDLAKVLGE
ncbi:tripartite tricarboxylate transporter substrate binding protein [Arthrobacter sp. Sa2BUA2]|uniref:Tripartite tricarboxylate transporter substrate binding protein n=2 Tax=Arthrobacter pullicola TaxID=2762224 RepID=A0ABR8YEP0_9MICC|nr:tripartite tricarboxylate transporter substrate binding protein [Arthrobacter pullicola]